MAVLEVASRRKSYWETAPGARVGRRGTCPCHRTSGGRRWRARPRLDGGWPPPVLRCHLRWRSYRSEAQRRYRARDRRPRGYAKVGPMHARTDAARDERDHDRGRGPDGEPSHHKYLLGSSAGTMRAPLWAAAVVAMIFRVRHHVKPDVADERIRWAAMPRLACLGRVRSPRPRTEAARRGDGSDVRRRPIRGTPPRDLRASTGQSASSTSSDEALETPRTRADTSR